MSITALVFMTELEKHSVCYSTSLRVRVGKVQCLLQHLSSCQSWESTVSITALVFMTELGKYSVYYSTSLHVRVGKHSVYYSTSLHDRVGKVQCLLQH